MRICESVLNMEGRGGVWVFGRVRIRGGGGCDSVLQHVSSFLVPILLGTFGNGSL